MFVLHAYKVISGAIYLYAYTLIEPPKLLVLTDNTSPLNPLTEPTIVNAQFVRWAVNCATRIPLISI